MSISLTEMGIDLTEYAGTEEPETGNEQLSPTEAPLNLERYIPVRNDLGNLQELLTPPENVDPYVRELVPRAAEEVIDYLNAPVMAAGNALRSEATRNLHESVQRDYCEHSLKGGQALEFLNGFCSELHNINGDNPPEIRVGFRREREQGGVRLQFVAAKPEEYLGVIRGMENEALAPSDATFGATDEVIKAVEVVVRPGKGTETPESTESYTPMQLNFRFLDENRGEITSLRLDVHNREASYKDVQTANGTKRERIVQFDGQVGGRRTETSHKNMHSLNDEGSPQENFKLMQAVFLTGLVEQTIRSGDHGIREGLNINERDLNDIKAEYRRAKNYLEAYTPSS